MIALLLALTAVTAPAGTAYYYGFPGNDSCADWTQNRTNPDRKQQVLEGWVLGFVTGYNVYGPGSGNVAPGVTSTALIGWVDQHCVAYPLDSVLEASLKLVIELKRRRQ